MHADAIGKITDFAQAVIGGALGISAVNKATLTGVGDATQAMAQYAQVWADAEAQAYYAALKSRFKVSVSESATAPREAASEPR